MVWGLYGDTGFSFDHSSSKTQVSLPRACPVSTWCRCGSWSGFGWPLFHSLGKVTSPWEPAVSLCRAGSAPPARRGRAAVVTMSLGSGARFQGAHPQAVRLQPSSPPPPRLSCGKCSWRNHLGSVFSDFAGLAPRHVLKLTPQPARPVPRCPNERGQCCLECTGLGRPRWTRGAS